MYVFRSALIMSFVVLLNLPTTSAQSQTTGAYFPMPVYSQPVYASPTSVVTNIAKTDPFAACKCGCDPSTPGDCKCKNLDCKLRLPDNCKVVRGPHKTLIPCDVYGKVPKRTVETSCTQKLFAFEFPTDVPEVHCVTDYCTEIGKKILQCIPGCCFSVCVPKAKCKTEKVECKLASKLMRMELWSRQEGQRLVYDVYVVNDKDPASAFHAGGMPARWLILHCASPENFNSRFPGIDINTGASLGALDQDAKPEATPADVKIELITDKETIKEHVGKVESGKADADGRKFIAVDKS